MSTPTPAEVLATRITGEKPEEEVVDPATEPVVSEESEPETPEAEESEETTEDALPDNIKDILTKNRKELREAKAELAELKKAAAKPEADAEPTPVDDRYKKLYINTAAKSALVDAGLSNGTERFVKMLTLDDIDVDDDGNVTGLTDQVKALTEEFSDLVVAKETTPAKKTVKSDAAGRRETPAVPKTTAELLAERMTGKR